MIGVDASSLPPCEAELQQHHIHRSAFVEIIWLEGLQLPDTLVPDREDAQCEDDDSAVVGETEASCKKCKLL